MSPQGGRSVFLGDCRADYIGSWFEILRENDDAMLRAASGASKAADDLLALSPGAASSGGDSGNAEEIQNKLGLRRPPRGRRHTHRLASLPGA
jgi:hypothetical protein